MIKNLKNSVVFLTFLRQPAEMNVGILKSKDLEFEMKQKSFSTGVCIELIHLLCVTASRGNIKKYILFPLIKMAVLKTDSVVDFSTLGDYRLCLFLFGGFGFRGWVGLFV